MDNAYVATKRVRSLVVPGSTLAKFKQHEGLTIGIVKEAEASASKRCTVLRIESGKNLTFIVLVKNSAGFLVGRLVLYDQRGKSVSWVDNQDYSFTVIARLKPQPIRPASLAKEVECPECNHKIAAEGISNHLQRQHWFPRRMDLEVSPNEPPSLTRRAGAERGSKERVALAQRICPNPSRWDAAFKQLVEYSKAYECNPSRPPVPLILAGWVYSNDVEKMQRWKETIDWAVANGCAGIVARISDQDFYQVEEPTDYVVGPMGGRLYRPWDSEAKVRPSNEDLTKHLEYLLAHWNEIAGPGLAAVTRPEAFTGRKARRLLVRVEGTAVPPWGAWTSRSPDESKRRTFTRFRSAVNKAIGPHEIDHIEFTAQDD